MKNVSIKKAICPKGPAKPTSAPPAQTMSQVIAAFNQGLGIRKVSWTKGYFVYLSAEGVIKNGQLNTPCKDDANKRDEFTFGNDAAVWEIVTPEYAAAYVAAANREALLKAVAARVSSLVPTADAAKVSAIAKLLKVSLPASPC